MIASEIILSVYVSHGGHDEDNYVSWMRERGWAPRFSSLVEASTSSSNSRAVTRNLRGFDSLDCSGLYGPECRGGAEDVDLCKNTLVTNVEGFRLRRDEYLGELRLHVEFHTRRG